jgi:polar amino acid transport system permease protein
MDWAVLWQYRAALAEGFATTLAVSVVVIVLATVLGVLAGLAGRSNALLLRRLMAVYTDVLRNLPLLVKLFFIYFVLGLPTLPAAIVALVLHQSAYIADVTQAGLRTVERGQFDAAQSLGLRTLGVYRLVVLPQMVRAMTPPMTSQYVSIVKNTSVVALIGVADLTFQTQQINIDTFRGFEAATAVTVLYMLLTGVVIVAMSWVQRRFTAS